MILIKLFSKVIHLYQRLLVHIARFPDYVRNFGIKVAVYIIIDRLFPPGRGKKYQKVIYNYMNTMYSDIAKYYDNPSAPAVPKYKASKIIWICWFQGEEGMPELVRICYKNLQAKVVDPEIKLTLITHENIDKYVEIPAYIKEKYRHGIISNAHYSDILRMKLLRKYGGCWIDATVFVTSDITVDLFGNRFNTLKMHSSLCPKEPCMGLWSGFFIVGHKEFALFKIIDDCLEQYWKEHDELIDYIFLDYIMLIAYRNNREVRDAMNSVPYNNEDIWLLWNNIEAPYSHMLYQEICKKGQYYKLSYQRKIKTEIDRQQTLYGYLTTR